MTGFFVFSAAAALLMPSDAKAATWEAKELLRSGQRIEVAPGETATFTIVFKNSGSATWTSAGRNFVSAYTYDPKYRKTKFSDPSWISGTQPARLSAAKVRPGETGKMEFSFTAPMEEGTYKETFHLAAEGLAWIPGGKFTVEVTVRPKPPVVTASGRELRYAQGYKAAQLLVSDHRLSLDAGKSKEFRVGFKNVGLASWTKGGTSALRLKISPADPLSLGHQPWKDGVVTGLPTDEVKPGQLALFTFTLPAPNSTGVFTPKFTLMAGDEIVDGGQLEIPLEVRQGTVPAQMDPVHNDEYSRSGERGPVIRIGLFDTRETVILAADGAYTLINGNHDAVRQLSGVTSVAFDFGTRTYTIRNGDYVFTAPAHVHFRPIDPQTTIFELRNHENRPTWDPSLNFNRFRGEIEVHYVAATGKLWVIEHLPVEDYLRGLAETSNGSPAEFQKSLVTAARTYALFVMSIGGKHESEYFDLDTSGNDQVYKGYASELVRPNVVRAVEETRGTVVTYGGEIVVTPYFSRSDGRTRSWTEVWSSKVHPWLVSVPAPYDQGKTLWGHGVGMSASDAVGRADAGAAWQDILKYYYTGIDLKKIY